MWWFLVWATLLHSVLAVWSTLYSFLDGKVYLQLKNNDLVALNFSITGYSDLASDYLLSDVNIENGQLLTTLAAPPTNASLFLHDTTLYAFSATIDNSLTDYDLCGDGVFQLTKYDPEADSWVAASDNITFSGVADISFYLGSTYLVSPSSTSIYIYGGYCELSGSVTNRLLSLDLDTMSLANITTSTKPAAFYGAASLWAPNPQTLLVVGGKSSLGWLNMDQMALWSFLSGWLSQEVSLNGSTSVSSRTNPLVLPVFSPLSDNSTLTFDNDYKPSEVLLVGGDSSGTTTPQWAKLTLSSNQWLWGSVDTSLDMSEVEGAAVIFNTLVVVNASATSEKRSDSYSVSLYDVSDFSSVSDMKSSTAASTSDSSSLGITRTTKVLVGTLVPIAALATIAAFGMYWWKRNMAKDDPVSIMEPGEYQLGHFRTASERPYSLLGVNPLNLYVQSNDSNSTLDADSMDSWVRKRQEYDAKRFRTLKRHSYLASNETLNSHLDTEEITEEVTDELPVDEMDMGTPDSEPRPLLPARVSHLKKSFSYTQTPPDLPMLRKKSRLDPGFVDLGSVMPEFVDVSDESCDENMDVQVLVSSKRKLVLRIVNPDLASVDERLRQRTPSK